MSDAFHKSLPFSAWSDPRLSRLPGILPLDPSEWIVVDEAFARQMALRDALIAARHQDVVRLSPDAADAAQEVLEMVVKAIGVLPGYRIDPDRVTRPDGVTVPLDRADPLSTAGRLVQEDLCLMQQIGNEHVLTGAVLCFPASWSLEEKFMRPLIGIHEPIQSYDSDVARRVQRLFDAIRPERPLWRANMHLWNEATLFAPRTEDNPRPRVHYPAPFVRSERQCLLRLPVSGAVVFSIHTYLLSSEDLSPEQMHSLEACERF